LLIAAIAKPLFESYPDELALLSALDPAAVALITVQLALDLAEFAPVTVLSALDPAAVALVMVQLALDLAEFAPVTVLSALDPAAVALVMVQLALDLAEFAPVTVLSALDPAAVALVMVQLALDLAELAPVTVLLVPRSVIYECEPQLMSVLVSLNVVSCEESAMLVLLLASAASELAAESLIATGTSGTGRVDINSLN